MEKSPPFSKILSKHDTTGILVTCVTLHTIEGIKIETFLSYNIESHFLTSKI